MNLLTKLSVFAIIGITAGLVAKAYAAPLKTDAAQTTVSITAKQMGVPVEAKFKRIDAKVDFDEKQPAAAKAAVDIEIASFDFGNKMYNDEILKKEWFNAAQFPKATFVSSSFKPTGNGQFNVTGKLTIKGKTNDVTFPMSTKKTGNNTVFTGTLPIKRLNYQVGEGDWKDTSMVADEVAIKFNIAAHP